MWNDWNRINPLLTKDDNNLFLSKKDLLGMLLLIIPWATITFDLKEDDIWEHSTKTLN